MSCTSLVCCGGDSSGWGSWCPLSNEVAWDTQFARLAAYKVVHGDCNVSVRWAQDPWLGTWVNDQRQRKRKLYRGQPSLGMTVARAEQLTALGSI